MEIKIKVQRVSRDELFFEMTGDSHWRGKVTRTRAKGIQQHGRLMVLENMATKEVHQMILEPEVVLVNGIEHFGEYYRGPDGRGAVSEYKTPLPRWMNKIFRRKNYRDYGVERGYHSPNEFGIIWHGEGKASMLRNDEQVARYWTHYISVTSSVTVLYERDFENELHVLLLRIMRNIWGRYLRPGQSRIGGTKKGFEHHEVWVPKN